MSDQAVSFLATAAAGAVLGLFYDFFRIFRRVVRHKTAATTIEDAIFWLVSTLLMFIFLLHRNFGEIRGFTFMGMALGAIIYFLTLSPKFTKFAVAVLRPLKKVVKKSLNSAKKYARMKKEEALQRMRRKNGHTRQSHKDRQSKAKAQGFRRGKGSL